jgi:hypothetical protein
MGTTVKNFTEKQKEEIVSIVDDFLRWDDLNNLKDFLFELQNQALLNTAEVHYTEKGANMVTANFSVLYDLMTQLKKYQK